MKRIQKSRLFFMELMVCILFFSVCSAICLGVFARAHQLSAESAAMTQALLKAQSAAETYKAADGELEAAAAALDGSVVDGRAVVYYDGDWAVCEAGESVYTLRVEELSGSCPTAEVCVTEEASQQALCTLSVAVHTEKEAAP